MVVLKYTGDQLLLHHVVSMEEDVSVTFHGAGCILASQDEM